jgi:HK97 family phage prohead protease
MPSLTLRTTHFPQVLAQPANRVVPVCEFRALPKAEHEGEFTARVMRYNQVDDYRTVFKPGVFTESMEARMPRIVWGHDWTDPLGRWVDKDDTRSHLDLRGRFDLQMLTQLSADGEAVVGQVPAVPRAHQAYAQLRSGTIDQFSVGFMPEDGQEFQKDEEWYFAFTRARLDEVSLVLTGAVAGTKLLSLRSTKYLGSGHGKRAVISKDKAAEILVGLQMGNLDLADALQAIKAEPEAEMIDTLDITDTEDMTKKQAAPKEDAKPKDPEPAVSPPGADPEFDPDSPKPEGDVPIIAPGPYPPLPNPDYPYDPTPQPSPDYEPEQFPAEQPTQDPQPDNPDSPGSDPEQGGNDPSSPGGVEGKLEAAVADYHEQMDAELVTLLDGADAVLAKYA